MLIYNGLGDLGSIPGCIIPKTLKMVLDTSLLNTWQYKVHIEGKVEQSRKRNSTLPYTSVQQLLKREPSGRPRLQSPTYIYIYIYIYIYKVNISIFIFIYIYIYRFIYMYINICIYIYICMYIYIHTCICIYICVYMYINKYVYIYIYIYVCMHVYIYIYACIYMCIRICMYMYIFVYIYIYIYMYVYMREWVCIPYTQTENFNDKYIYIYSLNGERKKERKSISKYETREINRTAKVMETGSTSGSQRMSGAVDYKWRRWQAVHLATSDIATAKMMEQE